MAIFGWENNSYFPPFYVGVINDEYNKLQHDSYEVYVNGDFVGNKILISQGERISDIDKHLQMAEFRSFEEETIGNKVNIKTNDLEAAHKIKQNLKVYLQARWNYITKQKKSAKTFTILLSFLLLIIEFKLFKWMYLFAI